MLPSSKRKAPIKTEGDDGNNEPSTPSRVPKKLDKGKHRQEVASSSQARSMAAGSSSTSAIDLDPDNEGLRGMKKLEDFPIDKEQVDNQLNVIGVEGRTMWREQVFTNGDKTVTRYCNVFTKHKQKDRPDVVRGGILAFEMGLGKTVISLSLVPSDKAAATAGSTVRPTLVVAPASLLNQWQSQASDHVATLPGTDDLALKIRMYREANGCRDPDVIKQDDITLGRIVLDEANASKGSTTGKYKAVTSLKGDRRWAVTATPVNNGSADMASLFGFLCTPPFETRKQWMELLVTPIKNGSESGLTVQPTTYFQANTALSTEEEAIYRTKDVDFRRSVGRSNTKVNHILTMIHDLRYCLALGVINSNVANRHVVDIAKQDELYSHGLVPSQPTQWVINSFLEMTENHDNELHLTCTTCQNPIDFSCEPLKDQGEGDVIACRVLSTKGKHPKDQCSMCHGEQKEVGGVTRVQAVVKSLWSIHRVDALVHDLQLREKLTEANPHERPYKSIVFSQWSKPLVLVTQQLERHGIKHILMTGGSSHKKRKAILDTFNNDPSVHVLVCTTGVAGHGLDSPSRTQST
ncbi:SNF2 family N-terminal domain-containing protein [Apiospora aurea]|uniref:SNF2 family N-terminal domain-containing protein n=1 Tax=Apiospora aurea TaxID=335848 RepID=A0ABR1QLN6_9PEZI